MRTRSLNYQIYQTNVHIEDSWKVSKREFSEILDSLRAEADSDVWRRNNRSLSAEWSAHNFCYKCHLFRSHTKDVDLNYPQKLGPIYFIFGAIAWLFIK